MATKAQYFVVFLTNDNVDESKKLMQVFMKECFSNTAKSCKWRSSTHSRSHFQFDVTKAGTTYEIDLYCLNGTEDSLKGPDFQADDGTHRTMDLELVKGLAVVGSLDDQKEKKYKEMRDEVKKRIATYKTEKGLGPKDCDFTVAIQNNVEGFDKDKLLKKVKEHKEWEPTKTLCASTSAELLEALVGSL
ncbi:uncharacterized protein LOC142340082 [Convolutriloba macropyga]|uniref:uncharacterized protein LOC142340082 n=1 Tax=Convolutriloba macropyga TaxID=536237 RepID=UPI003F5285E8